MGDNEDQTPATPLPLSYESRDRRAAPLAPSAPPTHLCPKCNGPMRVGFLLEQGHFNHATVTEWMEGEADQTFFGNLRTRGRRRRPVRAFRCTRCGFLEFYA